jgi:hypothetical protein
MQFNLDKRFIEILNEQGHAITWDQFRAAYTLRKDERESSPEMIAKRLKDQAQNERELAAYRALIASQR